MELMSFIKQHVTSQPRRRKPFLFGLTGLQASDKTTWTSAIVRTLSEVHKLKTVCVSLDDFYLGHDGLMRVRDENPRNELLRVRGQPGTHDTTLAKEFFASLVAASTPEDTQTHEVLIPEFDKGKFNGEGDRVPRDKWRRVTTSSMSPMDVVVVEGWCVGFQPLGESAIEEKWKEAKHEEISADSSSTQQKHQQQFPARTLQNHALSSYLEINHNLKTYCDIFMGPQHVDFLVHLDTDDLMNVYRWRLEQEHTLRKSNRGGMSDDKVIEFIKCYMPAYELYLEPLRRGFFSSLPADERAQKTQQRVVPGRDRRVLEMVSCV